MTRELADLLLFHVVRLSGDNQEVRAELKAALDDDVAQTEILVADVKAANAALLWTLTELRLMRESAENKLNTPGEPDDSFEITEDWLRQHGTRGMGWTSAQLRVLGVLNQEKGWLRRLVGMSISVAQKEKFERLFLARQEKLARQENPPH